MSRFLLTVLLAGAAATSDAMAQTRFVIADRDTDSLHELWDRNGDGLINEPGELRLFFNGSNAPGTLPLMNPTAMGAAPDGTIALGDQINRAIYLFRDRNRDGDALDLEESAMVADATNASGVSFAFPTGAAFDTQGRLHIVNAGNSFGNDGIYRLVDLDADGDFMEAGEITTFVGVPVFGPGNGVFSPQEIAFVPGSNPSIGFLHDSGASTRGIYRFTDANGNDRADDPGEFTTFFDGLNQSGVIVSSGFAMEIDLARERAVYILQTATGGIDQLYRLVDANNNGNAQDPGEATLVFQTAESGFTSIDVLSLHSGAVLVTDNSGKRVIALTDLDNDGLFLSAGERQDFFTNALLAVGDIRQIVPVPAACHANCDQSTQPPTLNVADFTCFLQAFAAGDPYANCDSSTELPFLNVADFTCFLQAFAAGCP